MRNQLIWIGLLLTACGGTGSGADAAPEADASSATDARAEADAPPPADAAALADATALADTPPPADAASDAYAGAKRIFVTDAVYSGNLKLAGNATDFGTNGAINLCNAAATAAGLAGSFKPLLSGDGLNAIDWLADVGPWYLVDGTTKVFDSKADLATGPLAPIDQNEYGETPAGTTYVWTGTDDGGDSSYYDCSDWTAGAFPSLGRSGKFDRSDALWINSSYPSSGGNACDNHFHLYCVEQ